MSHTIIMKDAFWQIAGRMISAVSGFLVVSMMTPLLGPLRYGDYTTILSYFALWSALADLGLYVIGLREIGKLKASYNINTPDDVKTMNPSQKESFSIAISQFVRSRIGQIVIVYTIAIAVAYMIPSYAANPYIARGLPLGMVFSALFMVAGIIQLPLQLFWKMEQVSIALVLARISQIVVLLIVFYSHRRGDINPESIPISLFVVVVGSVTISSIVQTLYTYIMGTRIISLRRTPFIRHMISHIRENGKYGAAFFLSSFHLLIVSLLISIIYPTVAGYTYMGIRGLALQLVQILLIIPAALANSLIHKISAISLSQQKKTFGRMITILTWFGARCAMNFFVFSTPLINTLSGKEYVTANIPGFNREGLSTLMHIGRHDIGSDILLPFLSIVLALSFIKTIFNYVFVAAKQQNLLFPINLRGVSIGGIAAFVLVSQYSLVGGLIAQLLMESLFLGGSLIYAYKHHIMPIIYRLDISKVIGFFLIITIVFMTPTSISQTSTVSFIIYASILNLIVIAIWRRFIKGQFRLINQEIEHDTNKIENT